MHLGRPALWCCNKQVILRGGFQEPRRTYASSAAHKEQKETHGINLRSRLDHYGKLLGVSKLEDWYKVGKSALKSAGAPATLYQVKGGVKQALQDAYPEHKWEAWRFARPLWTVETQRQFLEHLATNEFKIHELDGWYRMKAADVMEKGGSGLLQVHGGSLISALQAVYPDHDWQEWRFAQTPSLLWQESKNVTRFLDWLGRELRIASLEDWYSVHPSSLSEGKVSSILQGSFDGSLINALKKAYPSHTWQMWRFRHFNPPVGFWLHLENQKSFFDWAAQHLGFGPKDLSGFYKIPATKLRALGGEFIHSRYGGSLYAALVAAYPDHGWQRLMFTKAATLKASVLGSTAEKSQVDLFNTLYRELALSTLDDWVARVSLVNLYEMGVLDTVLAAGGLADALRSAYPGHAWPEDGKFLSKGQEAELDLLRSIILRQAAAAQDDDINIIKYFKHPILQNLDGPRKKQLSIDLFVPAYQCGIILNKASFSYTKTIHSAKQANVDIHVLTEVSTSSLKDFVEFIRACLRRSRQSSVT